MRLPWSVPPEGGPTPPLPPPAPPVVDNCLMKPVTRFLMDGIVMYYRKGENGDRAERKLIMFLIRGVGLLRREL